MFPLFETIGVQDGVISKLDLHQKRMQLSYAQYFDAKCPFQLKKLIVVPDDFISSTVKIRFLYSKENFEIQFSHYQAKKINSLQLVFNDSIDYSLKYTDRLMIDTLLRQKRDADDILIIKNGLISDTSIANIIFFDGRNWITPASPLLKGVCRSYLLQHNKIIEKEIHWKEIFTFEGFAMMNALNCDFQNRILPVSRISGL
jgi:4-amino-4-deoxychorismate lyase